MFNGGCSVSKPIEGHEQLLGRRVVIARTSTLKVLPLHSISAWLACFGPSRQRSALFVAIPFCVSISLTRFVATVGR
jgi:hypothetical protein